MSTEDPILERLLLQHVEPRIQYLLPLTRGQDYKDTGFRVIEELGISKDSKMRYTFTVRFHKTDKHATYWFQIDHKGKVYG